MKTNDPLQSTVSCIFGSSQGRTMFTYFSVITVARVDLKDKKLCRSLYDGVRKFLRQDIMKTGESGEFGCQDDNKGGRCYGP